MCEFPGCTKAFSNASDRAKHQNRTHSNAVSRTDVPDILHGICVDILNECFVYFGHLLAILLIFSSSFHYPLYKAFIIRNTVYVYFS